MYKRPTLKTFKTTSSQNKDSNSVKIQTNESPISKLNNGTNNKLTPKLINSRSKSNLTAKNEIINQEIKNLSSNITLGRNGSMPNLNLVGNRMQVDKTNKLRFEYDKYLSSLEALYVSQKKEKKIISNVDKQKKVFIEEFNILKKQLVDLSQEIDLIKKLKIEKKNIDEKFEVLEILNKSINFNESDEEIISLFTNTAYKVVIKNFKELNETDLNAVKILLNEIIDSLKQLDYENKTKARIELKEILIKVAILTKELDKYKLKCEELFDEQKRVQDYNSSLKIIKSQFGEEPEKRNSAKEEFDKILDNLKW